MLEGGFNNCNHTLKVGRYITKKNIYYNYKYLNYVLWKYFNGTMRKVIMKHINITTLSYMT